MSLANETAGSPARRVLYLLDAMALAYRSHFVFIRSPLVNSKGQNTSASYGFTTALMKLIEDHGMTDMAVVFDTVGPEGTFRSELFDEYKAQRSPIPEDLAKNLPWIKRIVRAMDVPVIEISGVEADDVIGTLACQAAGEDADVVIVSPDKDFQQLLNDRISIFRPAHRGGAFAPLTEDAFREKYGLDPRKFIDLLALMGDTSDNVPGVPGIGEKTAIRLIRKYGSVEAVLEHADRITGKRAREGLLAHRGDAILSKKLVTIKTDVEVELDWDYFRRAHPDRAELLSLFEELEFRSLFDRMQAGEFEYLFGLPDEMATQLSPAGGESVDYRLVREKPELLELAEDLRTSERFAFDTETTSTNPMWASLVGISCCLTAGEAWYVPTPMLDGTTTEEVLNVLKPAFVGPALKIGQNVKYDVIVLQRHGLRVEGPFFDTMVAHYLIRPEEPHGLDTLAFKFFGYRTMPISQLIGTGKDQRSMRDVPVEEVSPYACEDADMALRLADCLAPMLRHDGLQRIAEEIEFPLIRVLVDMEMTGIRVDPNLLAEISKEIGQQIDLLERKIHEEAGRPFNIASTRQLGGILFGELGLRVVSRTSTGLPSTKEDVLSMLALEHRLPGLVLDWRKLTKLKSTYVDSLGKLIHPETGRVHTNYNQTVAATGRLSSADPNLQNIPIRTEKGREVRRAFVGSEGWKLLSADYVQIELRILASISGDAVLSEAFRKGEDVHRATAAQIYGVPPEEVDADQRRKAKEVNYGIPYGISAWGLSRRLRCSMDEAQGLIDNYLRSYPGVDAYLDRVVQEAHEREYVRTILGRRRFVSNINSGDRTQRMFSERVAKNMPIQGSQADMIKIAMVHVAARLKREGMRARMLLQVHDELVLEVPPDETEAVCEIVRTEMETALELDVPVEVHVNLGDNWLDAH